MSRTDMLIWSIVLALVFLLGIASGVVYTARVAQTEAVQRGHGRYNPETGHFEWLPKDCPECSAFDKPDFAFDVVVPLTPEQRVNNEMLLNRLNNWRCE